jgi:hypothetical protein
MKILASATIRGHVDSFDADRRCMELAGLTILVEDAEAISAGDFVQVEATLGTDRRWTGSIRSSFAAASAAPRAETSRAPLAASVVAPAPAPPPAPAPAPAPAGGGSRSSRFGQSAQRNGGPAANASATATTRPRFVAGAADQEVQY